MWISRCMQQNSHNIRQYINRAMKASVSLDVCYVSCVTQNLTADTTLLRN